MAPARGSELDLSPDFSPTHGGKFTRLSPAIEVRQSFRGSDVIDTLERASQDVGYPKTIRLDNGPELPSNNAFMEPMNGKFRAECLNGKWFTSLDEARRKCEAWRRDYNKVQPHSAIGNEVPASLHRATRNPGQPVAR